MNRVMRNIGVIVNSNNVKAGILSSNLELNAHLSREDISILHENDLLANFNTIDLILVLGGDGTMLRAFKNYGHLQIPFLCVNFGTIGFLSAVEPEEFYSNWQKIINGDYQLDERSVLSMIIRKNGREDTQHYALNDAVIRTTDLHVSRQLLKVDNKEICIYHGDGLIISTSTGSTGYALSNGGAIVDPGIDCMIVSSICPRVAPLKTIILSLKHTIEVISRDKKSCGIFVDGIKSADIDSGDSIIVQKAPIKAKFVSLNPDRYFRLLRNKGLY